MVSLAKMIIIVSIVTMVLGSAASAARPSKNAGRSAKTSARQPTVVELSDFKFEPKVLTVKPGTMVRWINKSTGWHTVWADDGAFKSTELKGENAYFDHTFKKTGTFNYYCTFHGHKGGRDMAGTIIVQK